MAVYKIMEYIDGTPIQVERAKRDTRGYIISETYLMKNKSTDTNKRVYTVDSDATQSVTAIVTTATANTAMLRDASGRTQVATPAANDDAANKQYVDTKSSKGIARLI